MFAKKLLPFLFLFAAHTAIAQKSDTIRCGYYYGYGASSNGNKTGPWKYFYAGSNYPFAEGSYYSGMKTGEWKFYFDHYSFSEKATSLQSIIRYSQNLPDGPASFFYIDGRPFAKGQYNKGYADGKWEMFGMNPKSEPSVEYYSMGKTIGTWTVYSGGDRMYWTGEMKGAGPWGRWVQMQNGTQTGTGLYVNGKREGYWMEFTSNFIYEEGNYQAGKKEGYWVTADIDEGKTESCMYHNGEKDGPDSVFVHDVLKEIYMYRNGYLEGNYEAYNENGILIAKGNFESNPEFISRMECSKRKEPIRVSGLFKIDFIEAGQACKKEIIFSDDYTTTVLHRDTMLRKIKNSNYKVDTCDDYVWGVWEYRKSGNWNYFYANGKLKSEGAYSLTPKDSIVWDSTNQVEDPNNPGTYIMAPLKMEMLVFPYEGWWKMYNEKGILVKEERYEFGVLKETVRK